MLNCSAKLHTMCAGLSTECRAVASERRYQIYSMNWVLKTHFMIIFSFSWRCELMTALRSECAEYLSSMFLSNLGNHSIDSDRAKELDVLS